MGGLEPLAEGLGVVGGAKSLDRVAEEGLPCRLRHDGLRGGLVGVGGVAGADLLEGVHHVHPFSPSSSLAHFTQQRSSCKAGADHQARWVGTMGGEEYKLQVLERRGEDVDVRWWRGWRRLGERERRWRVLGVQDGSGRRGEQEGEVDMGRRWRAWRRLGERDWWWRELGMEDGYWRRGERGARSGPWGEGQVDVWQRWRAWQRRGERERWWRWLGVGVAYGQRGEREVRWGLWGEGEMDMGPQCRAWWRPGERERRKRGPGGSWWRLGSRSGAIGWLRRGGGVGSVGAGVGCAVRGGRGSAAVCGTGPQRSSRAGQEVSAGPGGPRVVPPGTGGGGGGPPISMDLPRRGVVAAAAGGMGRVTVPGGVGSGGPPRR